MRRVGRTGRVAAVGRTPCGRQSRLWHGGLQAPSAAARRIPGTNLTPVAEDAAAARRQIVGDRRAGRSGGGPNGSPSRGLPRSPNSIARGGPPVPSPPGPPAPGPCPSSRSPFALAQNEPPPKIRHGLAENVFPRGASMISVRRSGSRRLRSASHTLNPVTPSRLSASVAARSTVVGRS